MKCTSFHLHGCYQPSIVSRAKEYQLLFFGRTRKPNRLPVLPKTIKYMLLMVFGSTYTALAGMFATSPVHVQSDVVMPDLRV